MRLGNKAAHGYHRCYCLSRKDQHLLTDLGKLRPIAEMVHDIDLKDFKFGREETAGTDRLIAGIAMAHKDDETPLSRASAVFDDLYEYFRRKRG